MATLGQDPSERKHRYSLLLPALRRMRQWTGVPEVVSRLLLPRDFRALLFSA